MKNNKSNHALFKLELRTWIAKQIQDGKFNTDLEVLEYLTKQLGKHPREGKMVYYTVNTIKNYLYGQLYPINWKHIKAIHETTGIPKEVLNPYI